MNCAPGDFALQIAACPMTQENIGSFYDVIEGCGCHNTAWVCRPKQMVMKDVSLMGTFFITCRAGGWCCVQDAHLKPIRPSAPPVASPAPSKELEKT